MVTHNNFYVKPIPIHVFLLDCNMTDDNTPAVDEPLFDPSLKKKKKKKAVAFNEDLLGVEGGAEAPLLHVFSFEYFMMTRY